MTPTLGMTTAATQNAARLSAGTLNGAFRGWRVPIDRRCGDDRRAQERRARDRRTERA